MYQIRLEKDRQFIIFRCDLEKAFSIEHSRVKVTPNTHINVFRGNVGFGVNEPPESMDGQNAERLCWQLVDMGWKVEFETPASETGIDTKHEFSDWLLGIER